MKVTLQKLCKTIFLPAAVLALLLVLCTPVAFAAPAEPETVAAPQEDQGTTAYGETWTADEYLLAQLIHREAGNQDCIGQLAVAQVVINRVVHEKRGETIEEVIMQPHQFTVTDHRGSFLATVPTLRELIHARSALNDYFRELSGLGRIMEKVIPDNVMYFNGKGGRNHFYILHGLRRTYVRPQADSRVCDYCLALAAVSHLNLDGAVPEIGADTK